MLAAEPLAALVRLIRSVLVRAAVTALVCGATLAAATIAELESTPLGARSPRSHGAPLFTSMPAERTGIRVENRYDDPRMRGELYQEFETSSIGTGVAIGDYDLDGRPDLFITSKTERCRLFRNLGEWKFADVTEHAGLAAAPDGPVIWNQGAAFADVNNDGRLDLYVCRFDAPNLLYVNQGDGTFHEEAAARGLDLKDSSVMAAFADYDRDGWLDVYITVNILDITAHPGGQRGYLFHNRGDGTFENVTARAGLGGEGQSHSATWWDFDNDRWPDLYVGHDYGVPDLLYRNNRDGTFSNRIDEVLPHTSFSTMGADVGDVNNDGRIDFLATDMAATSHVADQRFMADARGRSLEPADGDPATPKYHRNALLLNTGAGRCLEAAILAGIAATDWTWSVRFEDLDQDGRLDLFATNGFPRTPSVDVIRRMMQASSQAERIRLMYESPVQAEANFAFRNQGDLTFEDVSAAWGLNHFGVSFGAAFGDLDGDGDLDLVHTNYREEVTVLRNDGDRGHALLLDLRGTTSNRFGVDAVVTVQTEAGTQVRSLTLARGYLSTSEPVVHFGLGEQAVVRQLTIDWPSGQRQTFTNVPADRRLTVTEPPAGSFAPADSQAITTAQFEEVSEKIALRIASRPSRDEKTAAQPLVPFRLDRTGPSATAIDHGRDRDPMVIVGGTGTDPAQFFHRGETGFTAGAAVQSEAKPLSDGVVLYFEANADDHCDLLITLAGTAAAEGSADYQPRLYLGSASGEWQLAPTATVPPFHSPVGGAAAVDFDRDGRLDVFLGARVRPGHYPFPATSALWRNRGGTFEDVTDALAPALRRVGLVTAALWSDLDDDGWPDLVLALEWGHVKYFHNVAGSRLEDWTERAGFSAAGTGAWTSLAAADFNGDGRPDIVAGNLGLNTPYQASPSSPALLYAGALKNDADTQVIEAYLERGTLYPRRTRRDLGAVLPSVLKRYPQNAAYARATLPELFGEEALARATRFAATEYRSGVFLSEADGRHRFTPFPRVAQIAPLQGLVTGDFDGDGRLDVYAVQNSHAPIPAVGRFDGGLSQLLRGDGAGGFVAVPPNESGLVVPGDAEALTVLDWNRDGWADFFVTRHAASSLAFQSRPISGRNVFTVKLKGTPANPSAIGARISVVSADGLRQSLEVQAGSGYLSQSTAGAFFGFPDGQPPRTILVRWPDGTQTMHDGVPGSTVALIQPPSAPAESRKF